MEESSPNASTVSGTTRSTAGARVTGVWVPTSPGHTTQGLRTDLEAQSNSGVSAADGSGGREMNGLRPRSSRESKEEMKYQDRREKRKEEEKVCSWMPGSESRCGEEYGRDEGSSCARQSHRKHEGCWMSGQGNVGVKFGKEVLIRRSELRECWLLLQHFSSLL